MKLMLYCFILATQAVGAIAFARAAQGHRVAILEAQGAASLAPKSLWLRAFGSAATATLMVVGLATQRWIGWDIGVLVMAGFFFLEMRRLRLWKGLSKVLAYALTVVVMLFSVIDLLARFL